MFFMLFSYDKVYQWGVIVFCAFFHATLLGADTLASTSDGTLVKSKSQKVNITTLQVKPAKCVALTEGRTCFATVSFTWQAQSINRLCLYQKVPRKEIACWQPMNKNSLVFDFESNETQHYQLINQQDKVLAETTIEVNWVYDASPKKRRWRVF